MNLIIQKLNRYRYYYLPDMHLDTRQFFCCCLHASVYGMCLHRPIRIIELNKWQSKGRSQLHNSVRPEKLVTRKYTLRAALITVSRGNVVDYGNEGDIRCERV